MTLRAVRPLSLLALSGALWSGCSSSPTEVVVRVDSNVATVADGGPLESVTVRVEYDATHVAIFERRVAFGRAEVLPGDVGIVAGAANEARALHVVVTAAFTGSAPVVREFVLRFVPEHTVLLDAWIDGGCRALTMPCAAGSTCGRDARCEPVRNPPLLPFTPLRLDAGAPRTDAAADRAVDAMDASAMDAAVADTGVDAPRVDIGRPETTVLDALTDATTMDVPVRDAPGVPLAAPRPLWPPSTSTVTSQHPAFEWTPVAGAGAYEVQLSRTRDFSSYMGFPAATEQVEVLLQGTYRPTTHVFWRVVARSADGRLSSPPSAVWQFYFPVVRMRTTEVNTAWGSIPDFNGDGVPELAVGAPGGQGSVTVYQGVLSAVPGSGTPGYTILTSPSAPAVGFFGGAVASAGDVDGDGFGDLAVGEKLNAGIGRVLVYFGSPTGVQAMRYQILSPAISALNGGFGHAVSTAGDVNHDGYTDLLVGAPGTNTNAGRAYLFPGGRDGLGTAIPIEPTVIATRGQFGLAVSGGGDFDGDQLSDFVIGAPGFTSVTPMLSEAGAFIRYRGNRVLATTTAPLTVYGSTLMGHLGTAVRFVGDVNGDGYSDLVAGAPDGVGPRGGAYLQTGFAGRDPTPTYLQGPDLAGNFGAAVSGGADVDGDGFDEFAVGAPRASGGAGVVYVFGGAAIPAMVPRQTIVSPPATMNFGAELLLVDELTGDAYGDLVVSTIATSAGNAHPRLYPANGSGINPMVLRTYDLPTEIAGDGFGYRLAALDRSIGRRRNRVLFGTF